MQYFNSDAGWIHHPHELVIIYLICFRAILEDSSNGSLPVDDPLWDSDSCVYLSHRIRLQKCQVPSEAQVSISWFRPPTKSMVQYVTISPSFSAETVFSIFFHPIVYPSNSSKQMIRLPSLSAVYVWMLLFTLDCLLNSGLCSDTYL